MNFGVDLLCEYFHLPQTMFCQEEPENTPLPEFKKIKKELEKEAPASFNNLWGLSPRGQL